MTEAENLRGLVAYRMEQAEEALVSASTNLKQGLIRSTVNRAYYAMFYAVLALLATQRTETSRHSGAMSLFDRDFVKPGRFPKDFSRWLHDGFNQRQDADYGTEFKRSTEETTELIAHAREFVAGVRKVLAEDGYLPRSQVQPKPPSIDEPET